ncbi:MAG: pentapeptide repeat-containing protein [Thermoanaerobaculales bacterium]|nr:pentapeptide repeat-containing protein [Thermoanaerobaculales bacterium]
MADAAHIDILYEGVEAWNEWRRKNPGEKPNLVGEDLSEMDLTGVNLGEADLTDAELFQADLTEANLKMAVLTRADLAGSDLKGAALYKADFSGACLIEVDLTGASLGAANFKGADLRGTKLRGADCDGTDLSDANLSEADLTGSNLSHADITGANLRNANLAATNLTAMKDGGFSEKRGRYYGIRGLDSCFGDPLFVRDAKDQDYLDTLEVAIDETPSPASRRWKRFWFNAWGLIDYGRSLVKLALGAFVVTMIFGFTFHLDSLFGWQFFDLPSTADSPLTPYYYSIVTYTRLGSGGITPTHWVGEIVLISERILGYVTLGLLLSILANKVARRS